MPDGRPLATTWRITPPTGLKPGSYDLTATARYTLDGAPPPTRPPPG
ncbi:NEW3 domain-containing protein [Streptomyces sp. NPDC057136]